MANITGDNNANVINGTLLGDVIKGLGGNDTINGRTGLDILIGGTGADEMHGDGGGDALVVGDGDTAPGEIYDGGSGTDALVMRQDAATVAGDFSVDFTNSQILSMEILNFVSTVDVFASFAAASFGGSGFASNLQVFGSSAVDHITITMGNATLLNLGGLTFSGWSLGNVIDIVGDSSNDTITGTSQQDRITAGLGVDSIDAGSGNDVVVVDGTTDGESFNGGADFDSLFVSSASTRLDGANLAGFEAITFGANAAVAHQEISLLASQFGGGVSTLLQIINETAGRNVVDISMGAETSFSANGFVTSGFSASDVIKITGDADSESITGSAIADVILGKGGSDIIAGGAGNDRLDGGSGADFMFGGAGDDTYVIDNAGDKAAEILLGADPGGTDIVLSSVTTTLTGFIENLTLTGAAAIDGTGNGLANQITGNSGANSLTGGAGADVLRGGGGNDLFVYNSTADSGVGGGGVRDIIKDFAPGDRIDVSAIDANELLNLNQAFQLDTDGIFTAGEFRFTVANGNTIIAFNTDGDATPEMQILVQNVTTMTAADLIL